MKTLEHAVFDEFKGNKSIAVRYATLSHSFKLVLYMPYKKYPLKLFTLFGTDQPYWLTPYSGSFLFTKK